MRDETHMNRTTKIMGVVLALFVAFAVFAAPGAAHESTASDDTKLVTIFPYTDVTKYTSLTVEKFDNKEVVLYRELDNGEVLHDKIIHFLHDEKTSGYYFTADGVEEGVYTLLNNDGKDRELRECKYVVGMPDAKLKLSVDGVAGSDVAGGNIAKSSVLNISVIDSNSTIGVEGLCFTTPAGGQTTYLGTMDSGNFKSSGHWKDNTFTCNHKTLQDLGVGAGQWYVQALLSKENFIGDVPSQYLVGATKYSFCVKENDYAITADKDTVTRGQPFIVTITGPADAHVDVTVDKKGFTVLKGQQNVTTNDPDMFFGIDNMTDGKVSVQINTATATEATTYELTVKFHKQNEKAVDATKTCKVKVVKGCVTVDCDAKDAQTYLGNTIHLSGTNTETGSVELLVKGVNFNLKPIGLKDLYLKDVDIEDLVLKLKDEGLKLKDEDLKDLKLKLENLKLKGEGLKLKDVVLKLKGEGLKLKDEDLEDLKLKLENLQLKNVDLISVETGNHWDKKFHLDNTFFDAGTYTIYAVAVDEPLDKGKIMDLDSGKSSYSYATTQLTFKKPFVTAIPGQTTVAKGDKVNITGQAEGDPGKLLYYVVGTNYIKAGEIIPGENGTYSEQISTGDMAAGEYFIIVQHPMYDKEFGVFPAKEDPFTVVTSKGDKVLDMNTLQKPNAAFALTECIDASSIDDVYVKTGFTVSDGKLAFNPIPDVKEGAEFTISGTTNLSVGTPVTVDITSSKFAVLSKNDTSDAASYMIGTTKVEKGDAKGNTFAVTFKDNKLCVGKYSVTAKTNTIEGNNNVFYSTDMNIVAAGVQSTTPSKTPSTTSVPGQPFIVIITGPANAHVDVTVDNQYCINVGIRS